MLFGGSDINNNESKVKKKMAPWLQFGHVKLSFVFIFKTFFFFNRKTVEKNVNNIERANKENVTAPDTQNHKRTAEVIRDGLNEPRSLSTTSHPR